MADLEVQGDGRVRACETLLRTCGGQMVTLQISAPGTAGDPSEELGLVTPQFQEVELGPAVWRKLGSTNVLLVSACSVAVLAGTLASSSVVEMLEGAAGIVVDGTTFAVESVVAQSVGAEPVYFTLTLRQIAEGD
jgi:hypothetical protein